jgi:hypothetical protein
LANLGGNLNLTLPVFMLPQLLVDVPGHGLYLGQGLLQVGLVPVALRSVLDDILQQKFVPETKYKLSY